MLTFNVLQRRLQSFLYIFAVLSLISVIGFIITGIFEYALRLHDFHAFDLHHINIATVSYLVCGIMLIVGTVVGLFGIHPPAKEHLVEIYKCVLLVLIALLIGVGIFSLLTKDDAGKVFWDSVNQKMIHYPNDTEVKRGWDRVQEDFKCCGKSGPGDWKVVFIPGYHVPDSCCKQRTEGCGETLSSFNDTKINHEGCADVAGSIVENYLFQMSLIAVVFGALHSVGVIGVFLFTRILTNGDFSVSLNFCDINVRNLREIVPDDD